MPSFDAGTLVFSRLPPLLDPGWAKGLRAELAWLADELGEVRDADVLGQTLRATLRAHPEIDAVPAAVLLRRLDHEKEAARDRLVAETVHFAAPACRPDCRQSVIQLR